MNEINPKEIEKMIYVVRGQKVMLDSDLAELYEVDTKVLNQAVKRNLSRFPLDFMFHLSNQELIDLRSQIVTSSNGYGGRRYLPRVGVAILSSVLANLVNISIMRFLVKIREYLNSNETLAERLHNLEKDSDKP